MTLLNSSREIGLKALKQSKKPLAIATRCSVNHLGTTLAGTTVGTLYRYAHVMRTKSRGIQFVYGNHYPTATTESSNANDIIVGCTIEYGGQVARVFFNGAARKTISQGGMAVTDVIYMDIPEGATFYSRTLVSVATDGQTYPQGIQLDSTLGDGKTTTTPDTALLASGALTASTESGYGPAAIIGIPVRDDAVAVALIGDSIIANTPGKGWPVQMVEGKYGYSIVSRPSSTASTMYRNSPNAYRLRYMQYFTHAIVNFGTNDFNSVTSYATQEGIIVELWDILQAQGLKVYHSTCSPRSTGTFTTIEGQTTVTANDFNGKRVTFNDKLRRGEWDVECLDISDVLEADRDSGIWVPNYTTDGIHPQSQESLDAIVANVRFIP
jgi:hypothetical protein